MQTALAKTDGVVQLTDSQGNLTDLTWGGTDIHWNASHDLTEIDYSNGNKATGFKYDTSLSAGGAPSNPLLPTLTGFTMTGKDGQSHTYAADPSTGTISIDGGPAVKGTLAAAADGTLTATETGDGSDAQYQSIRFDLSSLQVQSGKFGGKTEVDQIVGWAGGVNKFGYDATGQLNSVNAYGLNMQKNSSGQWVDASGNPVTGIPNMDGNGNFSITNPDGSYALYSGGEPIEGIPDTPQAIAAEAKAAQAAESSQASPATDSSSNGGNGSAVSLSGSGPTLDGKTSWFGGPDDPSSGATTASGISITHPGIAVYNESTLGGYWMVKYPNGRSAVLQQTDIGPAPWTGRVVDTTYSALPELGYTEGNFPTDGDVQARYLGKTLPQGVHEGVVSG